MKPADNFDLRKFITEGFQGDEPQGDGLSGFRGDMSINSLSDYEMLKLLMEIWDRIPLGSRMNEGGMPRAIPLQIRDLLNKKGYKIVKI
jgi:hypothetical protein